MKTPQEKKRLSYAKDRRNTYGENDKSSRKNIPHSKAQANRIERHSQNQLLSTAIAAGIEDAITATQLKGMNPDKWRKQPDTPLGEYLESKARHKANNSA
jgi:hypothetical protein